MNSQKSPGPEASELPARGSSHAGGARRLKLRHLFGAAVLLALIATVLLRSLVADVYTVSQDSMHPTLDDGERILVEKGYPDEDGAQRGDLIVFDGTGSFAPYEGESGVLVQTLEQVGHWFGIGSPPDTYVKRVIAVGGDTVACCDDQGRVSINGEPLEEPYLQTPPTAERPASGTSFESTVPPGRVWVMGDHREVSIDSRALLGAPGGGMISEDRIIGRATDVFWPWDDRRRLENGENDG
ncbi:signal peptidase I [Nesterenkonia cremea]|uniref:Signal peptidase I n=1 Tax=Nesterenkonia cremea TaxID=1882340 RepID=A0A917AR95_9MICC|nr:signal peptidase I [Nesterenkonia cremea]GGE68392.1 signal peptidase I [Nesterenkonia cremea]